MIEINGFPKGQGIEDFGNFPEGFCFKLNKSLSNSPSQISQIYVICTDNLVKK
jgi:hypothetical protein